jgi:hypothetical protein
LQVSESVAVTLSAGERGQDGVQGDSGVQGATGSQGATGATGSQGVSGTTAVTSPLTRSGSAENATIGLDTSALEPAGLSGETKARVSSEIYQSALREARTVRDSHRAGLLVDPMNSATPWSRFILNSTTVSSAFAPDTSHGRFLRFTCAAPSPSRAMRTLTLDASDGYVSFWMRFNDANITSFQIVMSSRTTNLSQSIQIGGSNFNSTAMVVERWNLVTVDVADAFRSGGNAVVADDNNIVDLGFFVYGSAAISFDVSAIRKHTRGTHSRKVIFQFDDGSSETHATAFPILREAGFVGSIPVEIDKVGTAGRMTLAQYGEVYAEGWEICGHHSQQIPAMAEADARIAFEAAQSFNDDNGWARGREFFIWPGGIWDVAKESIALEYFSYLRRINAPLTILTPWLADPHWLPLSYVTSDTQLASIKSMLDKVGTYGGNILLVFHRIVPSGASGANWNVADFQALVTYAKSLGLESATLTDFYG